MPGRYASKTGRGGGSGCDVPASLDGLLADALAQQKIRVVEILEKVGEERVAVRGDGFLDSLEHTTVHTFLVVWRFEEKGRDRGDKYSMAHVLRSVFADVTRHFAAAHRKPNQGKVAQFELRHDFVQIFGEGVVVVAHGWLARPAEPSAVVGDDAATRCQKHRQLLFPGSAAQRISVDEDHGVTRAMVFIVEINLSGVFFSDVNVGHRGSPSSIEF